MARPTGHPEADLGHGDVCSICRRAPREAAERDRRAAWYSVGLAALEEARDTAVGYATTLEYPDCQDWDHLAAQLNDAIAKAKEKV